MSQEDTPADGQEPSANSQNEGQEPTPVAPEGDGKTFSEDYVRNLRAEAAANRKRAQEAQAKVEEMEGAGKSEVEKLTTKLTRETARAEKAEASLLRFHVATEKQVPAEAVDLLTGATREELEANADKLLALTKPSPPPPPEQDGGAREPAPEPKSPDQAHAELLGALFRGDSVPTSN